MAPKAQATNDKTNGVKGKGKKRANDNTPKEEVQQKRIKTEASQEKDSNQTFKSNSGDANVLLLKRITRGLATGEETEDQDLLQGSDVLLRQAAINCARRALRNAENKFKETSKKSAHIMDSRHGEDMNEGSGSGDGEVTGNDETSSGSDVDVNDVHIEVDANDVHIEAGVNDANTEVDVNDANTEAVRQWVESDGNRFNPEDVRQPVGSDGFSSISIPSRSTDQMLHALGIQRKPKEINIKEGRQPVEGTDSDVKVPIMASGSTDDVAKPYEEMDVGNAGKIKEEKE